MSVSGLSTAEVEERISKGEVNSVEAVVSRSYKDIIVKNVFTTFNVLLFIMGAILLILNEPINALAATGVIILNILIATIQEIRAKKRLDAIALLLRPKVVVIRDGHEFEIDQADIVKDDVIILNPGDQALVDGVIIEKEYLEMDESLLTGESSTVRKHDGDMIYSGSFCVTGKGYYRVTAFGDESFASKMLKSARKYKDKKSPLQIETSSITKFLMGLAFVFAIINVIITLIKFIGDPKLSSIIANNVVIVLDIVPIALFLLIVIAYMVAAIRMANSGVLLQRSNAVESMSHVNTVCMDKTGTITTNKLLFKEMKTFIDTKEAEELLRTYVSATGSINNTVEAISNKIGKNDAKAIDEIRFSSERKFSAVKTVYKGETVTMFMGAESALGSYLDKDVKDIVSEYSKMGLRTVIISMAGDVDLYTEGEMTIPQLSTIGVIAIEDEVRPDCRETIDVFLNNGMDIKVISGDDPETVNSLFTIAKIPGERRILSGDQLDALEGDEKVEAILNTNIFGRMKPDHKELIVETLKANGRYVAMVGDGINDVKSLKMANVGVALQSGAGAARSVADMVLMDDNFSALPKALVEGKKTVSGMRDILKFYLSRNLLIAFMVFFILIIGSCIIPTGATPFLTTQAAVYGLITVTIGAFLMTIWAQPSDNNGAVLPGVLKYAIPTCVIAGTFAVCTYILFFTLTMNGVITMDFSDREMCILGWPTYKFTEEGIQQMLSTYNVTWDHVSSLQSVMPLERTAEIVARNAVLLFCIIQGITQMFMIVPHWKIFSIDGHLHKDIKPTVLTFLLYGCAFGVYYATYSIDWLLDWFPVAFLPTPYILLIIAIVAVWFVTNLLLLKSGKVDFIHTWFDRYYNKSLYRMEAHKPKIAKKFEEKEDE